MQILLSQREYEALLNASSHVVELQASYTALSSQVDALRSMYTELLMKIHDMEKWL